MNYETECTPEEFEARANTCTACVNFVIREDDMVTRCIAANCDINLMALMKDKPCPLGNW